MRISASGLLGSYGSSEILNVRHFPSLVVLSTGTLLATCRAGSDKGSDDGTIQMFPSSDNGITWSAPEIPFAPTTVEGIGGSYHLCYMTELEAGHLLAACLWIDRESYPGKGLFNPETEGCLPMAVLLLDSYDYGESWTAPRNVRFPDEIGPPSLTNPIIKLANGSLAMSIETNKHYLDSSKWYQKAVFFISSDGGKTWGDPTTAACDQTGRIFNWDQRVGISRDGTLAAFLWTYDSETEKYLNIHRRLSRDSGKNWSAPEDLGFSDQPGHPAMLDDGRVVLPWVDRFGSQSVRARLAGSVDGDFDVGTEIEIYRHATPNEQNGESRTAGELLEDMSFWSYGLPFAEVLPGGDVLILYYAGDSTTMNIHYSRISL
jgi:hypothetical protein